MQTLCGEIFRHHLNTMYLKAIAIYTNLLMLMLQYHSSKPIYGNSSKTNRGGGGKSAEKQLIVYQQLKRLTSNALND
jgi:hypothetical protein